MRKLVPIFIASLLGLAACATEPTSQSKSEHVSMTRKAQIVGTYLVPQAEQPVIFVELWIDLVGTIDFAQFLQEDSSGKPERNQVAYDEYLLSEDGSKDAAWP